MTLLFQYTTHGPRAPWGPPKPDWGLSMAYFYSAHNFRTGEHFGFDVISSKVFQIEFKSSRKSNNVLTQYPDSKLPSIWGHAWVPYKPITSGLIWGCTDLTLVSSLHRSSVPNVTSLAHRPHRHSRVCTNCLYSDFIGCTVLKGF